MMVGEKSKDSAIPFFFEVRVFERRKDYQQKNRLHVVGRAQVMLDDV
jgi:hypothetical protein